MLFSREEFKKIIFKRDSSSCVICGNPAIDAHHIINRNLFKEENEFGGYFLDNGVSLCGVCHIKAEKTLISCKTLRDKAGIQNIVLPSHFETDCEYDVWGNVMTSRGVFKGEMYYNEEAQKILKDVNIPFVKYIKYPRTYHLPNSCGTDDDKILKDDSMLVGLYVIVTAKLDGESFGGYNDFCHARSLDSNNHESRSFAKQIWMNRAYLLDDNMKACCENLYAEHTIHYTNLDYYLYLISFWIDDICLSWKETLEYAQIINLPTMPVIYEGIYDREKIHNAYLEFESKSIDEVEGYVIRIMDEFKLFNFGKSVAKYVNPKFRQKLEDGDGHWLSKKIVKNELRKNSPYI